MTAWKRPKLARRCSPWRWVQHLAKQAPVERDPAALAFLVGPARRRVLLADLTPVQAAWLARRRCG